MSFDFDGYDEAVENGDGRDPLREDCFEDNMLMIAESKMSEEQYAEYIRTLRLYESKADSDTFSASIDARLYFAHAVLGTSLPTVADLFERITGGGFMDEVDVYRLIWND